VEGDIGVALKVDPVDLHMWKLRGDHWSCSVSRGYTRTSILPKHRKRQRCKGLLDRLAKDAEFSLGHNLVEFCTPSGQFTICSTCGFCGTQKSVNLSVACSGGRKTRRGKEQYNRVFVKGRHPRFNVPLGLNLVIRSAAFAKKEGTRSYTERRLKKARLTSKSKPWVAASMGIIGPPRAEGAEADQDENEEAWPDIDWDNDKEEDLEEDPFELGNLEMDGNVREVIPPSIPQPEFNLEDELGAVLELDLTAEELAIGVLEHQLGIPPAIEVVETDPRSLQEKLLDKWKAKQLEKASGAPQAASSSSEASRWWE
jgi:hypothetical protein